MQRSNSQTSTSTNLYTNPPNLENWVERKEEIETIQAWLNNPQINTVGITQANTLGIQGLGGVGKSALAAYMYNSLDFEAKFWADVSLKPDFTVFAEQAIKALDGQISYPINATQLINNLLQLLSQRRCLLVVDNLETLLHEDRKWHDENYQQFFNCWQQQGINSTLLITTQDKPKSFQGIQQWYLLGGMKIEEGINLLNKLAIRGTAEELKTFVEYVDGHPLTIKLVAGYLKEYCDSHLNQVAELGLEQFDLAYTEAEGLHRNKQDGRLSWIIQQHLNRLNPEQQKFLTNLSVYRLPFNREAASYMWIEQEVKPIVIQKQLQELFNRSLLVKTEYNKFQFETLVQKYILQQANDLANAHQKAIEYYKANLKDEKSWRDLEDITEYLEIHDHYCKLKLYDLADQVLDCCLNFLFLRGYYKLLEEIYDKLIYGWKLNLKDKEKYFYAQAINKRGNSLFYLGKYENAVNCYQQVLKICQEIKDVLGVAHALNNLGNVYTYMSKYKIAIDYLDKSLRITQDSSNFKKDEWQHYKYLSSNSLNNLGNVYNDLELYQTAIDYVNNSLQITKETEDDITRSHSYNILGNSYKGLEDYKKAFLFYKKHWKIVVKNQDINEQARYLNNIGDIHCFLQNYQLAIDLYQQSLKIKQEIGDLCGIAKTLVNIGNIHSINNNHLKAIDYYQQSLIIAQQIGDKKCTAKTWFNLGSTQKKLYHISEAKSAYENARKLYKEIELYKNIEDCDRAIQELENTE